MGRSNVRIINPLTGIDLDKATKDLDRVMKDFIVNALKTFVIRSTDPIPVWSGASRASFKKLAAIARTTIDIAPVAPIPPGSRIDLGVGTSEGFLIKEEKKFYGWTWSSDLDYIHIVDDRVAFVEKGIQSVQNLQPNLPKVEPSNG